VSESVVNAAQAEHWNSEEARHWVDEQARYDRMLAPFGDRLLEVAALADDESVLDIGCGTGQTTCGAARRVPSGRALGLDISRPMIAAARDRADREGIPNVAFEVGDAQSYVFAADSVDVAISRFGVMFFDDPITAFANVRGSLRVGGRLAFVCWQDLFANEWMALPGLAAAQHVPMPDFGPTAPGPFSLGDRDHVRRILEDAGYRDIAIEPWHAPLLLGGGGTLDTAIAFLRRTGMARALFADAEPDAVDRAIAAVAEALAPHVTDDGVQLGSATWIVTATCG
jgi:SAM-dependent methyltransferase